MIDAKFIANLEGFTTRGHVPDVEGSKSGVTIGIGVDLGNTNLNRLHLPQELHDKLIPYKGKKGKRARKFLNDNPLNLTEEEAMLLSQIALVRYTTFIKNYWNTDSLIKWGAIPDPVQTVAFSVLYQYGRPNRVPKFWKAITDLDIKLTIAELRDFGDHYPTRRNKEADYLEQNLDLGETNG